MFGLFAKTALEFDVAVSPDRVRANLNHEIHRGNLKGQVTESLVIVRLHGMLPHRPYQPTFRGRVSDRNGGASVAGSITYPISLRLFTEFFLGFSVLWTLGAFVATRGEEEVQWMPLWGLVFLAVGIGFFKILQGFVGTLAEGLESEIRNAAARVA